MVKVSSITFRNKSFGIIMNQNNKMTKFTSAYIMTRVSNLANVDTFCRYKVVDLLLYA